MKKRIVLMIILSSFFIACSSEKKEAILNDISKVAKVTEEKKETTESVKEKKDFAAEENFYDFQQKVLLKYANLGITDFEVGKYAKGAEIVFTTIDRNFSKKKFEEMSKDVLNQLYSEYEIDKTVTINSSINYKKDTKSNSVFLYLYKSKTK